MPELVATVGRDVGGDRRVAGVALDLADWLVTTLDPGERLLGRFLHHVCTTHYLGPNGGNKSPR